tara:strand:- start:149 stop:343 length:195 start_codon:yes stop_codon:yes gene_type:complete
LKIRIFSLNKSNKGDIMKKITFLFGIFAFLLISDTSFSAHCSGGHKEIKETKETTEDTEKSEKN